MLDLQSISGEPPAGRCVARADGATSVAILAEGVDAGGPKGVESQLC
jgi:hypothetical protein